MHKMKSLISLAIIVTQFTLTGCKKDELSPVIPLPTTVTPSPTTVTPSPTTVTPPATAIVSAGPDIEIEIPRTYVQLACTVIGAEDNIRSYHWKKISGPESYFLEGNSLRSSTVIWMEEGEYEFEVTVKDNQERIDSDTVKVTLSSNLKKHVINNITRDVAGFSTVQIPVEVINNIKWVFARSGRIYEQADAGPHPNINYDWGGYYYNLLPGNQISVYGNYSVPTIDVTIYY